MKILGIYLNDFVRTGGQRRYLELLEGLAARGNEVFVLMDRDYRYSPANFVKIPIRVRDKRRRRFFPHSLLFLLAVRRQAKALLETAGNIDCVHIHGELHLAAALYLTSRFRAPLFFAYRSNAIQRDRIAIQAGYLSALERASARVQILKYRVYEFVVAARADLIAFQSASDEQDFLGRAHRGRGKTVIIPGAIDGPRFKPEFESINKSQGVKKIVYVGLLHESKGIVYLLEAMGELKRRGIEALSLEVLGRGESVDKRRELCASLGISESVSFRGQVADPFPAIAEADLMVYPSLYDAYPDVVLEALHVGTPVIASSVGGIPDQLIYEELLFPPMDAAAMADRIERCVREPTFYRKIRDLCAERKTTFLFDWAEAWERAANASFHASHGHRVAAG